MEKKCCICGKVIDGFGNNANPIKDGICCDDCNLNHVIPGRILLSDWETVSFEIVKSEKEKKLTEEKLESRDFEKMSVDPIYRNIIYKNVVTDEVVVMCLA